MHASHTGTYLIFASWQKWAWWSRCVRHMGTHTGSGLTLCNCCPPSAILEQYNYIIYTHNSRWSKNSLQSHEQTVVFALISHRVNADSQKSRGGRACPGVEKWAYCMDAIMGLHKSEHRVGWHYREVSVMWPMHSQPCCSSDALSSSSSSAPYGHVLYVHTDTPDV